MLKRLTIWTLEILCETFLGSLLLIVLWRSYGPNREPSFTRELWVALMVPAIFFVWGSGYWLSTALVGAVWRSKRLWFYPTIACLLFVAHLQWLFTKIGGFNPRDRLVLRLGGVCIVLACTLAGTLLLRRWNSSGHGARSPQS